MNIVRYTVQTQFMLPIIKEPTSMFHKIQIYFLVHKIPSQKSALNIYNIFSALLLLLLLMLNRSIHTFAPFYLHNTSSFTFFYLIFMLLKKNTFQFMTAYNSQSKNVIFNFKLLMSPAFFTTIN